MSVFFTSFPIKNNDVQERKFVGFSRFPKSLLEDGIYRKKKEPNRNDGNFNEFLINNDNDKMEVKILLRNVARQQKFLVGDLAIFWPFLRPDLATFCSFGYKNLSFFVVFWGIFW